MANGRVCTGFSNPWVALYSASGTTVTYTSGQALARGVEVSIEPEDAGEDNNFYADNEVAETVAGTFNGGTCTLTVDGLKDAAEKLILGLPTAGSDGLTHFGDSVSIPYVGIGFVVRYQEAGAVSYVPMILPKCKFAMTGLSAATQEQDIEWQTQELTATIYRDDTANHDWKVKGEAEDDEADAVGVIKTFFGVTSVGG